MFSFSRHKTTMVDRSDALAGRPQPLRVSDKHFVNFHPLKGPFPDGYDWAVFGLGCFWGAEKCFWKVPGVWTTAVGYAGGFTPNPTYEEVCSGRTGHTEVVLVVWDPKVVSFDSLLQVFWEAHDPTQGMRQGNDVGTQYRSAIYMHDPAQIEAAKRSAERYSEALAASGYGAVTTEIGQIGDGGFFYAEDYHQQYLAKNPDGYCGLGGTGVSCPAGTGVDAPVGASTATED